MEIMITSINSVNDFQLEVMFSYNGHDLRTAAIPKKSTQDEVKEAIKATVDRWLDESAAENFAILKQLEGTTVICM